MPYLRLHLSDFGSSFGVGEPLHEGWRASWTTRMCFLETVSLSNGSDLATMEGLLQLRGAKPGEGSEQSIGALYHLAAMRGDDFYEPKPESYSVEVVIDEAQLLRLMELERQGNGPTGVSVNVPDLGYGVSPDGSAKKWQLSENRNWLSVEALTFSFNKPDEEEKVEESDADLMAIENGPSPEVQAVYDVHKELQKLLFGICGLLVAILSVLLLKR